MKTLKKDIIISIAFVFLILFILCSCSLNEINLSKTIVNSDNNLETPNSLAFFSVKVLPNGNYIKFYVDLKNDTLEKLDVIDGETDKVINSQDISECELNHSEVQYLDNCFYLCGYKIYVFDYEGNLLKAIDYPEDFDHFNLPTSEYFTSLALSNDCKKIIYVYRIETDINSETKYGIKLKNLDSGDEMIVQDLNIATTDKPSSYDNMHFSSDDKYVLFRGSRYVVINSSKDCYGVIDLDNGKIYSEYLEGKTTSVFNYGKCIIFDDYVSINEESTGYILKFDYSLNTEKIILENKNESQAVCFTNDENMLMTALADYSDYSITLNLYENNDLYKSKTIKCSKEIFEGIDLLDICYTTKNNSAFYSYNLYNDDGTWGGCEFCKVEMK